MNFIIYINKQLHERIISRFIKRKPTDLILTSMDLVAMEQPTNIKNSNFGHGMVLLFYVRVTFTHRLYLERKNQNFFRQVSTDFKIILDI